MNARIETADELDALPDDAYWTCGCRYHGAKIGQDAYRLTTGRVLSRQEVVDGHLPLTILWTPDAPRSSDAVRALRSVAQTYRDAEASGYLFLSVPGPTIPWAAVATDLDGRADELERKSAPVDPAAPATVSWPAWVTVALAPCATASCTDCGCGYGDVDEGTRWHFDSPEELVNDIAKSFSEYDPDDPEAWQIVGDALLCRSCAAARVCTASGHTLTDIQGHEYCSRCGRFPELAHLPRATR